MNAFEQALEDIRRSTQQSVQLQTLQTGLLAQISANLSSIHAEIALARQHQAGGLAIQQELLARERVQAFLEELIYRSQQLVAECSKPNTGIPPDARFFMLNGVLVDIERGGIATPIIRGRDNKAAFDAMVGAANALRHQLRKDPQVQQAIAWAEQLDEERRRDREEEEEKRKRDREEEEEKRRRRQKREREEREREERERERERREMARDRAKQDQQVLWIVLAAIGVVFGSVFLFCVGCCTLPHLVPKR